MSDEQRSLVISKTHALQPKKDSDGMFHSFRSFIQGIFGVSTVHEAKDSSEHDVIDEAVSIAALLLRSTEEKLSHRLGNVSWEPSTITLHPKLVFCRLHRREIDRLKTRHAFFVFVYALLSSLYSSSFFVLAVVGIQRQDGNAIMSIPRN